MNEVKRYRKGHFLAIGLAAGIPLGIPIGLILGNIALGPAIGVAFGLIIGMALEKSLNKNPLPLTKRQVREQKKRFAIVASIGFVLFMILILVYFYQS